MLGTAAEKIYEHGLVKGLKIGNGPPSYIPSGTFALTLLDLVAPGATTPEQVKEAIEARAKELEPRLMQALRPLISAAEGKMEALRANIQGWFDAAMDRVSGTYRRSTQWGVIVTSLAIAFSTNMDSIRLANTLLSDDALRTATVEMVEKTIADPEFQKTITQASQAHLTEPEPAPAPAPTTAPEAAAAPEDGQVQKKKAEAAQAKIHQSLSTITELGMPIGWGSASARQYFKDHPILSILGLLVTAIAGSQGAPFWFDLLCRFVGIRSTVKPQPKKKDQEAAPE